MFNSSLNLYSNLHQIKKTNLKSKSKKYTNFPNLSGPLFSLKSTTCKSGSLKNGVINENYSVYLKSI